MRQSPLAEEQSGRPRLLPLDDGRVRFDFCFCDLPEGRPLGQLLINQRAPLAGGKNWMHDGVGASANTPVGLSRPFASSIRQSSSVSEF